MTNKPDTTSDTHNSSRRGLLKLAGIGTATIAAATLMNAPANAKTQELTLGKDWDKTFKKSDAVEHQKVTFINRYGITLAGDLYMPKERPSGKIAALAIAGPFGAVKEQAAGLYAQTMAERGFVTLAFDPSFVGESQGAEMSVASPDINTEDYMAAVDFLGLHDTVDRERIGIIGICGFGGMALNAVAADKRVKAVATASMYDMSRVMAKGYYDALTDEQRAAGLEKMSRQRWEDAASGQAALAGGLPDTLDGINDPVIQMYYRYYKTERGYHPRSVNSNAGWTVTNPLSFMNMPLLSYVDEIAPRPMLLIAGSEAHSKYFSDDAYANAADPKELMIIEGADHCDLYDQVDIIPFDKLQSFFEKNLA
ncbi:alpha/beta hydrolase [Cohaesibacter haloalkalitolerans]|uniref:alpha/beta hydrolase n=1 Tax=Cohaesibacter haloalkalitolerans TaxID=1162980 RepID=UPI000E65B86F|nr:alpha/beta hydrolase [Cohaesibacter haloalkalitolerans]